MGTGNVVGWFSLPAGSTPAGLLRALRRAGYLADPPSVSRYACLFVETQDGRLARAGYRLSVRQARGSAVWHLSGPEGESEVPFEGEVSFRSLPPDAAGIPAPIKDLAADHPLLALV